jgi:hypothetical protein
MGNNLTDQQELFLDLLFSDEFVNDPRGAANVAGYSQKTPIKSIMNGVKEEIIGRTDLYLVLHAPKSVKNIINVLDNPAQAGAKARLDAAAAILDRAGLSKKERVEVEHKAAPGVILLPPKKDYET